MTESKQNRMKQLNGIRQSHKKIRIQNKVSGQRSRKHLKHTLLRQ